MFFHKPKKEEEEDFVIKEILEVLKRSFKKKKVFFKLCDLMAQPMTLHQDGINFIQVRIIAH